MIPILYDSNETLFTSNGLGRLRDCISCKVTEERNGVYECDFTYPIDGAHFDEITCGRIVGVTHEDSQDIQPFDIVSHTKPINGIVSFHATHISYRQSLLTVKTPNAINTLANAFTLLGTSTPANPFNYWTNKTSVGYLGAANGIPRTVRQILGGVQGSILDAYGGEYEFDKWTVRLWNARGQERDFSIRYGVNMTEFTDDMTSEGTYSSCIPYWTNGTDLVVGNTVNSTGTTITGRGECVPLDLSSSFESQPTTAQLEAEATRLMSSRNPFNPTQTIKVSFARLQDLGYEELSNLFECRLCDMVNVVFPSYDISQSFKIVRTVWDVLSDRYESMELGSLSVSLAQALGIGSGLSDSGSAYSPSSSRYLPLSGGTLTGNLAISKQGDYAGIDLYARSTGQTTDYGGYLRMYSQGEATPYGMNGVLETGGNLFIGSGESPASHYALYQSDHGENTYLTSDDKVFVQANGNTIANRRGLAVWQSGANTIVSPSKADTLFNGADSDADNGYYFLGADSYRWYGIYSKHIWSTNGAINTFTATTVNGLGVGGSSGDWWGKIPTVQQANGVMEVGKYIDFHDTDAATSDYDARLYCNSSGSLVASGAIAASNYYVGSHNSPIGTVIDGSLSANKNIAASTATMVASVSLPAGTWICTCGVRFASNANGWRLANLETTSGNGSFNRTYPAVNGTMTQVTFTKVVSHTSQTTYYLNAYSTVALAVQSGGANWGTYIRAVRIQ